MKFLLLDYSNEGILYVSPSPVVINSLKIGLVDTKIRVVKDDHIHYDKLSNSLLQQNHYWLDSRNVLDTLKSISLNEAYLQRKTLIKLRAPLVNKVVTWVSILSQKSKFTIWDNFENNLELMLDQTSSLGNFMLNEYAHINEIDTVVAQKEIKLLVESVFCYKSRLYAQQKFFLDQISKITSVDECNTLKEQIDDKFYRDSMI